MIVGAAPSHTGHALVAGVWLAAVAVAVSVDRLFGDRRPVGVRRSPAPHPVQAFVTWPPAAVRHPSPVRTQVPLAAAWLPAAGALVGAGVHASVMPQHFRESVLYGLFFAAAAAGQAALAVALLRRPSVQLLWAGAVANAAVVAVWLWTRTVGVPLGPGSGAVEAVTPLDALATAAEVLVVLGCLATRVSARAEG